MGYTTIFDGRLKLSKKLTDNELIDYHNNWLEPRHTIHDDKYTTGREDAPSIWLKWNIYEEEGDHYLEWTGAEKFYGYYKWLQLIVEKFLEPKKIYLQGKITYSGEDNVDAGLITAHTQTLMAKGGDEEEYQEEKTTILNKYNAFEHMLEHLNKIKH
jgi:hypothetical protein